MRVRVPLALFGATTLLVAACTSGATQAPAAPAGGGGGAAPNAITAELSEWTIKLDSNTGAAGTITITIQNKGEKTHEFVVLKTDTAADKLPVVDDEVPEDQAGEKVGEKEDIKSGTTETLVLNDLKPGHYVFLCNLTGHYAKGMHADFTVSS